MLVDLPILICFLLGLAFLIVEVFLPGFGLPGISGILLEIAAITLIFIHHGGVAAVGMTLVILGIIGIVITILLRSIQRGRLSKSPIILKDIETVPSREIDAQDLQVLVGTQGITTTALRPVGIAKFHDVKLNVLADGEYIPAHEPVVVERMEGKRLIVKQIEDNQH